MELDWNDLRILDALTRGGSVAGAARLLSVDASTVSRRLAALEEALGARLVLRTGRELTWTAEGQLALDAAAQIGAQVEALTRGVRAAKTGVAGPVKVSCTPAMVVGLTPVIAEARARYPELTVELSGQMAHADVAKGEADIAVRSFQPDGVGLVVRRAVEVGWYVIAAAAYARDHGLPATEAELRDHPVVLYGAALRGVAGPRWLEERCAGNPRILRLDSPDAVTYAVATGAGVGVVPYPALRDRGDLVRVFPDAVAWAELWIVYHESQRDTPRVRAVVELLGEHFAEHRAAYTGAIG